MKSILSYMFAFLLLLNVFGYYGVFMGMQYKNAVEIASLLDNDSYDIADEITIKVPLAVPYVTETPFTRVDGDFEYQGEFYKLVKQRLHNDTLVMVCIKDHQSKKIHTALADYVKTFTDKSDPTDHDNTVPSFIRDYIGSTIALENNNNGWTANYAFNAQAAALNSTDLLQTGPPPRI